MRMTVEQALSVFPLSEGKLIAGRDGLNRVIYAVHVMQSTDMAGRVKEGDMLIASGASIQGSREDAIAWVRSLHQRGTAGISVSDSPEWREWAAFIAEEADRLSLPVIALPDAFNDESDIDGLLRAGIARQLFAVQDVLEKQKKLMRLALKRDKASDPSSVLADIMEIVGLPAAIIWQGDRVLLNATSCREAALLQHWRRLPVGRWKAIEGVRLLRYPLHDSDEEGGGTVLFQSVGQTSKAEDQLLLQAAELIASYAVLALPGAAGAAAPDDLGTMFLRYLQGGIPSRLLMERARKSGVMLCNGEYYCVLGVHKDAGKLSDRGLSQALMAHPQLTGLQIVHFTVEQGSLYVVPAETFQGVDKLAAVLRECAALVRGRGGPALARVAISYKKPASNQLREAYAECVDAIRLADGMADEEVVIPFSDKELAYLFEGIPRERMSRFYKTVLKKLSDEENDHERELMRTLDMFLQQDAQVGEAAKRLYIHRNTAAYRLEKIGEMLEVDFKKTSDLLRMKLAFLFRHMLMEENTAD
ncbi:transcriptional regulator, PucR family [Paenibacillus curdlanolyticus YK9]|uniref:Transcriptional regulator, PucR family n=1 Tax=Paenibacillus curdlanolyticus YK9 TaxID=717606 RepID=E0IDQ6_9BACL|nr:PucR family transcriptional regulator [Paenibacillus curdlanolyticus]EFM09260.1 transcriptional regulator, PucR family [Paenibacillus curdlanolyticus YK9]